MLAILGRAYAGLINGLAALAALLVVVSIGLVIANVASRAMGYGSFQATIAAVEYILLYFTLLSAPYLLHNRGHVMVDMVIKNLSGLPRRLLESVIYLIGIAVSGIFVVVSVQIMRDAIARGTFDERSVDLPYWLLYAAFPLCFGLLLIEFARYLLTSRSLYDTRDSSEGL
ncbi:TRAP transporter small permease [Alkalilacustris brevis]|uniref:TRAP transporter small permease n=1 Tax=Alkalilacustris brevis TaxID=2026338 RepID=UPI000E0CE37C|nr:TRAP transporter small permease [Alkalilacustris brevis]